MNAGRARVAKILLSSIGSRGDIQPLLSLALELRACGQTALLCVPPNFKAWVESFGIDCLPLGPDVQKGAARLAQTGPVKRKKPSGAQLRELARQSVRDQFRATLDAARGCDLILVAGALQTAGRSVAEALKIPYVFAAYCPAALRSPEHPPARMRSRIRSQSLPRLANRWLWMLDERSWNHFFRDAVNEQRAALGLPDITSVPGYVSTDRPWLAADPALAPAASTARMQVTQTGAWLLSSRTALPDDVEKFLAAGEPPVYLGFGSMFSPAQTSQVLLEGVRKLGRRAILSQGWANLTPGEAGSDCLCVGDLPHEELFPRVAAIVHHGGAGTTVTSARSGTPQVVIPHHYDQFYWSDRVSQLGIGVSGPRVARLTVDSLVAALRTCLAPEVRARASSFAYRVELRGARIAAERLVAAFA